MNNLHPMMAQFNHWSHSIVCQFTDLIEQDNYRQDQGLFFGSVHNTQNLQVAGSNSLNEHK
jgi:uncharacterized damage-inducible protein DinB